VTEKRIRSYPCLLKIQFRIALTDRPIVCRIIPKKDLCFKCDVEIMGIFGKNGPKTPRGTLRKMVTGDGRKSYGIQTSDEIYNLSGGIFGKKKRR